MSDLAEKLLATVAPKLAANENQHLTALQRQALEQYALEERREAADALALSLTTKIFAPQLADFQEVLERSGLLRAGEIKEDHAGRRRRDASAHSLIYAAAGNRATVRYQVRLVARAVPQETTANVELRAECLTNGVPDFAGRTTWHPLVALPRKMLAADPLPGCPAEVKEAAEAWCTEVLKLRAAALMHADANPGQPFATAPLCAPLDAAPWVGQAMSFEL